MNFGIATMTLCLLQKLWRGHNDCLLQKLIGDGLCLRESVVMLLLHITHELTAERSELIRSMKTLLPQKRTR